MPPYWLSYALYCTSTSLPPRVHDAFSKSANSPIERVSRLETFQWKHPMRDWRYRRYTANVWMHVSKYECIKWYHVVPRKRLSVSHSVRVPNIFFITVQIKFLQSLVAFRITCLLTCLQVQIAEQCWLHNTLTIIGSHLWALMSSTLVSRTVLGLHVCD